MKATEQAGRREDRCGSGPGGADRPRGCPARSRAARGRSRALPDVVHQPTVHEVVGAGHVVAALEDGNAQSPMALGPARSWPDDAPFVGMRFVVDPSMPKVPVQPPRGSFRVPLDSASHAALPRHPANGTPAPGGWRVGDAGTGGARPSAEARRGDVPRSARSAPTGASRHVRV